MKIDGECHCGDIAFEAELDPKMVGICHCTDCQALSASAFRVLAVVMGGNFRLTRGVLKTYVKVGDSGNPRVQAFCGNCGAGIYASDVGDAPKVYNLRAGVIRQRDDLTPQFECWHSSALSWMPESLSDRKFGGNPKL